MPKINSTDMVHADTREDLETLVDRAIDDANMEGFTVVSMCSPFVGVVLIVTERDEKED